MFKKVLLPLAGYESVKQVKELARYLTFFDTEEVVILNVSSSPLKSGKNTDKYINEFAEFHFVISQVHKRGDESEEILKTAKSESVDLICFPWKKKTHLKRIIFGSRTKDVIRLTNLPVFIFKNQHFKKNKSDRTVLFATDFEKSSFNIISYITDHKLKFDNLVILNSGQRAPDPEAEKKRLKKVYSGLDMLKNKCTDSFFSVETVAAIGSAGKVIIRNAKKYQADLIVLGKNDESSSSSKILGTSAETVSQTKYCSVLLFPPQ
ncbi:MAG: universal stress protein [Thermodesulfobacteriota bacterium]